MSDRNPRPQDASSHDPHGPTSPGFNFGSSQPVSPLSDDLRPSYMHPSPGEFGASLSPQSPPSAVPRVPIGSAKQSFGGSTTYGGSSANEDEEEEDEPPRRYSSRGQQPYQGVNQFEQSTDRLNINRGITNESIRSAQSGISRRSKFDSDWTPDKCPSKGHFYQGATNWLAITILILCLFSTVFSGIFLVISIRAPRYGKTIQSRGGTLTPAGANVLTQVFAKLIELSFVCTFVTFLGQVLSRRMFSRDSRGVTLAEMNMRQWIMQPGSMITHYETVQFAGLTFLGAVALSVAIFAALYSTAASALISPVLRFGDWENRYLWGQVKTSFANPYHLASTCNTPVQTSPWNDDFKADVVGSTCLTIETASQGFHNYQQFMALWTTIAKSGAGSDDVKTRPPPVGLYLTNTTINGTWLNNVNVTDVSLKYNRIIDNVTMALPHLGVFNAARDPKSGLLQPEDLDGVGSYNIRAAVPIPYMNVLCANVFDTDIAPFVFSTTANNTLNATQDLPTNFTNYFNWGKLANLTTPVDDIFGWTPKNRPPVFYKFPINHNTILNTTQYGYGRDSIYFLGNGPASANSTAQKQYALCKAKAGLTPNCYTTYTATGTGGSLAVVCDPNDPMSFIKGNASRVETTSLDWFNVGSTAFTSLSLNTGVTDGNAANSRTLMDFMLQEPRMNPALPSLAEALSVMVGASILMSSLDSPFVEFWNYSANSLDTPQYQAFNASVQAQEYSSGGQAAYQRGFNIVLLAVFLINVFVLIYMIVKRGLVTDYTEPPNLFAVSLNSPPSLSLAGACGAGPEDRQYALKWGVEMEDEHLYVASRTLPPGVYGSGGVRPGGARAESMLSFGDLLGRRKKFNRLESVEGGIEMAGETAYGPGHAGPSSAPDQRKASNTEEEDDLGELKSMGSSRLGRAFSKIAKRRSVL